MNVSKIWIKSISYIVISVVVISIIPLHLFPCFVSGFLIYEMISLLTSYFETFFKKYYARNIAIFVIAICIISFVILSSIGITNFFNSNIDRSFNLVKEINKILFNIKYHIPNCLSTFLPKNTEDLKNQLLILFKYNLITIHSIGKLFFHGLITVFIGIIIGIIISLNKPSNNHKTYFIIQLMRRFYYLSQAFHNIVFAQLKVSLINTILTSLLVLVLLPIFNVYIPLYKILILITFLFGLIPIIGNLVSNFIIVISAISVSLNVGIVIMLYLIVIHKLEYILNAEIVGNSINAKSWELLLAMLFFESMFGFTGLIAAPIYYAYLKKELKLIKLI